MRSSNIKKLGVLVFVGLLQAATANASSLSDSILNTPDGTIFKLNYELVVPAKSNFVQLGESSLDGLLNDIAKTGNQLDANMNGYSGNYGSNSNRYGSYANFNVYSGNLLESAEQSYRRCVQAYKRTYRTNPNSNRSGRNNTVINNWGSNTNITVDNGYQYQQPTYGSYTEANSCQPPNYSMSALVINPKNARSGGIFRQGYEFKVRNVRHRRYGRFHKIYIDFNHKVAQGIVIITTHNPDEIRLHQLSANRQNSNDGFWGALAEGLASMGDVAGDNFEITTPDNQYFD